MGEDKFPNIDCSKFVVQGIWSDDELKKMIGETLSIDPMKQDIQTAMRKLLTQILLGLEAAPIRIQSQRKESGEGMDKAELKLLLQSEEFKEIVAETANLALKEPLEKLSAADALTKEQAGKIATLEADKAAREEAATKAATDKAAQEEAGLLAQFKSWLKPGKEAEADALFAGAKSNIWKFKLDNPGHFVTQAEEKKLRFAPSGSPIAGGAGDQLRQREDGMIVQGEGDSEKIAWSAMGIKSPEQLAKDLQLPWPGDAGGK